MCVTKRYGSCISLTPIKPHRFDPMVEPSLVRYYGGIIKNLCPMTLVVSFFHDTNYSQHLCPLYDEFFSLEAKGSWL